MIHASTLVELLQVSRKRDRAVVYLEGENAERRVGNAELYERALAILYHLQKLGAKPGDKLILFLNNNEQFIDAFWAGVMGGITPVPVATGISDEHRHKLLRIVRKLGKPFLYTEAKAFERIRTFAQETGAGETFAALEQRTFLVDHLEDISKAGRSIEPKPDDPLFIQFSSGSTSEPKGVVLTHGNVLANARGSSEAAGFNENDVSLSWMPLTHDMGLVGFHLIMFANGVQQHIMPTELFVRRPLLWMQFAASKRTTITCSPNFGYRHFLKVLGDRSVEQWDLSSVRQIFNGAEPISIGLCEEFLTRMAPAKLKRTAMYPVYGLAEASLAVSFPKPGEEYRFRTFDRHQLNVDQPVVEVARGHRDAIDLICVGKPIPYCEMRLTDDAHREVAPGRVGHIEIRGANVTRGYFEDAAVNAELITTDGWLNTGDLGLNMDGEFYITGRAKDIIFVAGQNYYPHDLEAIAQRAQELELNKVAVAAVRTPDAENDEIAVFVLHRGSMEEFAPIALEVSHLVNEHAGLEVQHVVPVKRIPKTTSGKLQRHLLAEAFANGEFETDLQALRPLLKAKQQHGGTPASAIAQRLKTICDAIMPDRSIGTDDNLFDIGVSSLKLVEIHENIDREFPGQLDLTEIFDHPTIAQMAKYLEQKTAA